MIHIDILGSSQPSDEKHDKPVDIKLGRGGSVVSPGKEEGVILEKYNARNDRTQCQIKQSNYPVFILHKNIFLITTSKRTDHYCSFVTRYLMTSFDI